METWKIVSLSLSGAAILWNIFNTVYTSESNRRNKRRLVNLEEFRSRVRDPLEEVLRKGETEVRELKQIALQHGFPQNFEGELLEANRELIGCLKEAEDRLMDADESRFSEDVNWIDLYDSHEEQIMNLMNQALDPDRDPESRADDLERCRREYRRFKKKIVAKIEIQVTKLAE